MVAVVDYGAGNLKSAFRAFRHYWKDTTLISRASDLPRNILGLILPGDGAFPYAFDNLNKRGFVKFIRRHPELPLFGICVGFQLLFTSSEEHGGSEGLDLIPGRITCFAPSVGKVPHIGWNQCRILKDSPLLKDVKDNDFFLFYPFLQSFC